MPFLKPHDLEIVMKNYQVFPLKASPLFIYIFYSNGPFIFFPLLVIQFQYSHVYMSGKDPDAGKDWRQEEWDNRGWDGWMVSSAHWTWAWANSEMVKHREAWGAAVHGVTKSQTQLSDPTKLYWTCLPQTSLPFLPPSFPLATLSSFSKPLLQILVVKVQSLRCLKLLKVAVFTDLVANSAMLFWWTVYSLSCLWMFLPG